MDIYSHTSVLLKEAVDSLNVKLNKKYIDATAGGGGHTSEILQRGGLVLAIDRDKDAVSFLSKRFEGKKVKIIHDNFANIGEIAKNNNFIPVDGILLDLGVSSYQMDTTGRGFSIKRDEVLDMRMNQDEKLSAYEVVNNYPKESLVSIFYSYGEEHDAEKIADAIVQKRKKSSIRTTHELASIVEQIVPNKLRIHPATRIFQALRIEVNQELEMLKKGIDEGIKLLNPGARMSIISFHSLEDRIVKQSFEALSREGMGFLVTKKPTIPRYLEIQSNRRARSAKLRVFEKK